MKGMKELFDMTRHERRGSIVVLVLIALLLALTCVLKCNRGTTQLIQNEAVEMRQFEAEVDSTTVETPKQAPDKPASPKKKRHRATPKPPKSSPEPRRLDPVPQI